jgi:hypothetical protein
VKIGMPAVLITAAALATAITACSSSPSTTAANSHHGPRITAGPKGLTVVLRSDPVCRQFQKDQNAWKTAITEPGDVNTVLFNASTRPAWLKFGRQLEQLSHAKIGGENPQEAARTQKNLARAASLFSATGAEPFRQFSGAQYQRAITLMEDVTGDCTVVSG